MYNNGDKNEKKITQRIEIYVYNNIVKYKNVILLNTFAMSKYDVDVIMICHE